MSELGAGAFREEVMFAGLSVSNAWRLLHSSKIGHLEPDDYMQLCREAGFSEEAAQRAATEWANKKLDARREQ